MPAINVTGITQAELTDTGTASRIIDVSGFTHPATLAGSTAFVFGPNFANTTIASPLGNDNVIDITGVGDPLTDFTVSANKATITDSNINDGSHGVITQTIDATHAPAAHIDVELGGTALQAAFASFVADLAAMSLALENTTTNPIPQLNNQLPFLSRLKNAAGKAANLLNALGPTGHAGLDQVFAALEADINGFTTATKLSDLITQLNSITFNAPAPGTDDTLGLGINLASSDYQGGANGTGGTLALLVNMPVTTEERESFAIDLGSQAQVAGVSINGNIELDTRLVATLKGGVVADGTPILDGGDLDFNAEIKVNPLNANANIGFLQASISGGSIDAKGELDATISSTGSNFFTGTTGSAVTKSSSLTATLPLSITSSSLFDSTTQTLLGSASIGVTVGDLFGDPTPDITVTSNGANLLDFSNIQPSSVLAMLGDVANSFSNLAQSQLLKTPIPFTGENISDVLNFAQSFSNQVLNPLRMVAVTPQTQGSSSPNQDAVQVLTVRDATGGTFTLTFEGKTTTGIAYNASESDVATALGNLSSVNVNGSSISVSATDFGVHKDTLANGAQYTITFQGKLANKALSQMTGDSTGLTSTVGGLPRAIG